MTFPESKSGKEPTPEKPKRVLTNNPHLEITIPNQNQRVFLDISPDGTYSIKVEPLSKKEELVAIEEKFTKVVRRLIFSSLGLEAAKLTEGEEGEAVAISSFEEEFDAGVNYLIELNRSDKEVRRLIKIVAGQISAGEQKMGELSPPVKEIAAELEGRVEEIYLEKARSH